MIFLRLFLVFLEVGAVSFGGGYGMIALIRELVLANGWLTEEELLDFIAVAESTPGPIAVNMATFVGNSQAGVPGALCATLGVVLPSFVIILLVAAFFRAVMKHPAVQGAFRGIRPAVVGLILATGAIMLLSTLFGVSTVGDAMVPDLAGIILFAALVLVAILCKKLFKKSVPPILVILLSALAGMAFFR